jgi:hypothetical protein
MGLRRAVGRLIRSFGRTKEPQRSPSSSCDKAGSEDLLGRFRDIISDPLNLLIERDPRAGSVEDDLVWLHNGNRVKASGEGAYYGGFSDVLILNRGVHEPLEEYVFQEVMRGMPDEPIMLELGAFWGHYSMWMKRSRPRARVFLVEPDPANLRAGRANFTRNGYEGVFLQEFVGRGHFQVDRFLSEEGLIRLNILHADIQGFEIEMLEGCADSLRRGCIDLTFISTHSQILHDQVRAVLSASGMRVEVSSGFDFETTSYDGFIFASRKADAPVFSSFSLIGRTEILGSRPEKLVSYLSSTLSSTRTLRS